MYPRKAVVAFDKTGKKVKAYPSLYGAGKKVKRCRSNIFRAIQNTHKSGGFYWRYHTASTPLHIEPNPPRRGGKPVICFLKSKKISVKVVSIAEASRLTKIPESTVRARLKNIPERFEDRCPWDFSSSK